MIPIVLEKIVVILPSAVETEAPIDNLVVLAPVRSSLSMAESILRFLFEGIHVHSRFRYFNPRRGSFVAEVTLDLDILEEKILVASPKTCLWMQRDRKSVV